MDLLGKTLAGKYKLIKEIGRGGMAIVFEGMHLVLDKKVAVKVLHGRLGVEDTFRERLIREAKSAAKLDHPNIVQVYDAEMTDQHDYIVMEYVEGMDLKAIIEKQGPLPVNRTLNIASQIASALECAHAQGIVHRDVKPQNVLVAKDDKVKVADFGIAKATSAARLTMTGMAIGTPEYMSPEQAEGERELDKRSDIYSLGIVMYEMLTGKVPFEAKTPMATLVKHIQEMPKSVQELRTDIPDPVAQVIHTCLEKEPEKRYQNAGSLIRDLELVRDGKAPEFARPVEEKAAEQTSEVEKGTPPNVRLERTIPIKSMPKKEKKEEAKPIPEAIRKPPAVKKGIRTPVKIAIGVIGIAIILGMFFYLPAIMKRSVPAIEEAGELDQPVVGMREVHVEEEFEEKEEEIVEEFEEEEEEEFVEEEEEEKEEEPEVRNGYIHFSLNPGNSKVYIDGKYESDANKYTIHLKPGKYSITVKKEHYSDWGKTVEIKSGKGEYLTITLKPKVTGPPFVQPEGMYSHRFLKRKDVALDLANRYTQDSGWKDPTNIRISVDDINDAEDAAVMTYVKFVDRVMSYWVVLAVRQSDRTWKIAASHRMLTKKLLKRYGLNPRHARE